MTRVKFSRLMTLNVFQKNIVEGVAKTMIVIRWVVFCLGRILILLNAGVEDYRVNDKSGIASLGVYVSLRLANGSQKRHLKRMMGNFCANFFCFRAPG